MVDTGIMDLIRVERGSFRKNARKRPPTIRFPGNADQVTWPNENPPQDITRNLKLRPHGSAPMNRTLLEFLRKLPAILTPTETPPATSREATILRRLPLPRRRRPARKEETDRQGPATGETMLPGPLCPDRVRADGLLPLARAEKTPGTNRRPDDQISWQSPVSWESRPPQPSSSNVTRPIPPPRTQANR
jgi:hypothetical protein